MIQRETRSGERQFLLQFGCADLLPVAETAALKQLGVRKLADDEPARSKTRGADCR